MTLREAVLSALAEHRAHRAAKTLQQYRIRREREEIRRVARQLCVETGMKVPPILRG